MRILFLLGTLFTLLTQQVAAQQSTYERVLEDASLLGFGLTTNHSVRDAMDGLYIAGSQGDALGLLMRTDTLGLPLWATRYTGGAYPNIFPDIRIAYLLPLPDKDLLCAGFIVDTATTNVTALLMRCDSSGAVRWSKNLTASGLYSRLNSVAPCPDGGFICTGGIGSALGQGNSILVFKTDSAGQLLWSKSFSGFNLENVGRKVVCLNDNSCIITGFTENINPFEGSAVVMRLSSGGNLMEAHRIRTLTSTYCAGSDLLVENERVYLYLYANDGVALAVSDTSLDTWNINPYTLSNFSSGTAPTYYPGFRMVRDGSDGLLYTARHGFGGQVFYTDTAGIIQWARDIQMLTSDAHRKTDGNLLMIGEGPLIGVIAQQPASAGFQPEIGILCTDSLALIGNCLVQGQAANAPFMQFQRDTFITVPTNVGLLSPIPVQASPLAISNGTGCVSITGGVRDQADQYPVRLWPNPSGNVLHIEWAVEGDYRVEVIRSDGSTVLRRENYRNGEIIDTQGLGSGVYTARCIQRQRVQSQRFIVVR